MKQTKLRAVKDVANALLQLDPYDKILPPCYLTSVLKLRHYSNHEKRRNHNFEHSGKQG